LVTGVGRARPPLFKHPGRVAIVVLALIAAVNLAVFVLARSDTSRETSTGLPVDIVSLQPRPGELIRPQDTVTAQVRTSLTGVLVLDGQEIPEDQTDRVPELGEISFRTSPRHPHGAETYGFIFGDGKLGWVTDSGYYEGIAEDHRAAERDRRVHLDQGHRIRGTDGAGARNRRVELGRLRSRQDREGSLRPGDARRRRALTRRERRGRCS